VSLFIPDTNACALFMRGHEEIVRRWLAHAPALRLSPIVIGELEYGAAKLGTARQRTRLQALVTTLPTEPFTLADAVAFGRLRAHLARRGELIGPCDLLLAAQALRLGAAGVTHNHREFSRVPGLKVEDWQSA
jgi:tRNA(fMet)-specific endonuclease VapC